MGTETKREDLIIVQRFRNIYFICYWHIIEHHGTFDFNSQNACHYVNIGLDVPS